VPNFGSYQTSQMTGREVLGTFYVLNEDAGQPRILHALEPNLDFWKPTRIRNAQSAFIASYDLQRLLAKQSSFWAQIYDLQTTDAYGAFCIQERLDWPVSRLIQLRIKPTPADLYKLVKDILSALQDCQRLTERSHGDLKAENVLASQGTLSTARIVLRSPKASIFNPAEAVSSDLEQLGRLICELMASIRWSPSAELDPSMSEFRALGFGRKDWVKFCRFLLDTTLPADQRNLATAANMAAKLKPRKSHALLAGMAAWIVFVTALTVWFLWRPGPPTDTPLTYVPYNTAYVNWFKDFAAQSKALSTIPEFANLSTQEAPLDPQVLAPDNILNVYTENMTTPNIQQWITSHRSEALNLWLAVKLLMDTEYNMSLLEGYLQQQDRQWLANHWLAESSFKQMLLDPMKSDTPHQAASLLPFLKDYNPAGTGKPCVLWQFAPGSGGPSLAQWLKEINTVQQVAQTDQQLSAFLEKNFNSSPHALINHFPAYAQNYLTSAYDPESLLNRQKELLTAAQQELEVLKQYGDQVRWDVVDSLPQPNMNVSLSEYFPDLRDYLPIPDSSNPVLLNTTAFAGLADQAADLISDANQFPNTQNFTGKLDSIKAELDGAKNIIPIRKNLPEIKRQVAYAMNDINALLPIVNNFVDAHFNLKKWVPGFLDPQSQQAILIPSASGRITPALHDDIVAIPAVHQACLDEIGQVLLGRTVAFDRMNAGDLTKLLKPQIGKMPNKVREMIQVRDSVLALIVNDFPKNDDFPDSVKQAWTQAISSAVSSLHWGGLNGLAPSIDPASSLAWKQSYTAFESIRVDLNKMQRAIADCLLLDEQLSVSDRSNIADLYAVAQANPWWSNPDVQKIYSDDIAVVVQMQQINTATLDVLKNYLVSVNRSILILAIWQRLGSMTNTAAADLIDIESRVPARLGDVLNTDENVVPARKQKLLQILPQQYNQRWVERMNWAATAAQTQGVSAAAVDYGIVLPAFPQKPDIPGLNNRYAENFDLFVYQFVKQVKNISAEGDDPKTQQKAQQDAHTIAQEMNGVLGNSPEWKPYTNLLEPALDNVLNANLDLSQQSGPAMAGWKETKKEKGKKIADGDLITFTSPSGYTLNFVYIVPDPKKAPGLGPYYFCTTDLSVGIFLDVVNNNDNLLHNPANDFYNFIVSSPSDPQPVYDINNYLGPHTWWYDDVNGQVSLAPKWFTDSSTVYNAPRFPTKMADPKNPDLLNKTSGGAPSLDDPVQYLPPGAAIYLAALLGCRLPTTAEWDYAWQPKYRAPAQLHLPGKTLTDFTAYITNVNSTSDARLPRPNAWDLFDFSAPPLSDSLDSYGTDPNPVLFFEPVDVGNGPTTAISLGGNVADYVFDNDNDYHTVLNNWFKDPNSLTSDAVNSFMTPTALEEIDVIGGSALSPLGDLSPDKSITIDWQNAPQVPIDSDNSNRPRGFSDVGVRLVYDLPTPLELLREIIERNWYQAPAAK
jgi:hypothetical protein